MYKELKQLEDEALLQEYSKNPTSNRGLSAHAELQHRQYNTTKQNNALLARYNKLLVLFTIVLAICGVFQAMSATIQSYIALKAFSSDSREITAIHKKLSELEEKIKAQEREGVNEGKSPTTTKSP
jgi:hypothetical protein